MDPRPNLFALVTVAVSLLALPWAAPGLAEPCDLAVEPAATLLLPYFEVDLDDPEGINTLFSIHNAEEEAALVHVVFWTDYGIPTLNFNVFLTGFDVATINLRSALGDGFLPHTASSTQDPDDTISPHGREEWDGAFESCNAFFPYTANPGEPIISPPLRDRIRRWHTGLPDVADDGSCRGSRHSDEILRGYVTIDVVHECSFLYPSDPGYFGDGGTGLASNSNQLFGDFYLLHPAEDFAQGDSLVHIQAFDGVGPDGAWEAGDTTFYGRYVDQSAIDNREPLPSVFGARYLGSLGASSGGTDLLVWRDTLSSEVTPIRCTAKPDWFPIFSGEILDFDEQENVYEACGPVIVDPPPPPGELECLPLATQRLSLDDGSSPRPIGLHGAGWLRLDLDAGQGDRRSQAWVVAILDNDGRFSVGLPAAALGSPCDDVAVDESGTEDRVPPARRGSTALVESSGER